MAERHPTAIVSAGSSSAADLAGLTGSCAGYLERHVVTAGVDGADAKDATALLRLRDVCRDLAGADEGELQGRPLFRVGRRRFTIFNGSASPPRSKWSSSGRSLHFLADPLELDALGQDPRFSRSPHQGSSGWLALSLEDQDDAPGWPAVG